MVRFMQFWYRKWYYEVESHSITGFIISKNLNSWKCINLYESETLFNLFTIRWTPAAALEALPIAFCVFSAPWLWQHLYWPGWKSPVHAMSQAIFLPLPPCHFTNQPHVSLYMGHFLWCKSFDLCNIYKHFNSCGKNLKTSSTTAVCSCWYRFSSHHHLSKYDDSCIKNTASFIMFKP